MLYPHKNVELLPGKKKTNLNISKSIKGKTKEYAHNIPYENAVKNKKSFSKYTAKPPAMVSMNIRENSDHRKEIKETIASLKSGETQLMNYTHKSK